MSAGGRGEATEAKGELLEQDLDAAFLATLVAALLAALAKAADLGPGPGDGELVLVELDRILAVAGEAGGVGILGELHEGVLGEAHDAGLRGEALELGVGAGGEEASPAVDLGIIAARRAARRRRRRRAIGELEEVEREVPTEPHAGVALAELEDRVQAAQLGQERPYQPGDHGCASELAVVVAAHELVRIVSAAVVDESGGEVGGSAPLHLEVGAGAVGEGDAEVEGDLLVADVLAEDGGVEIRPVAIARRPRRACGP